MDGRGDASSRRPDTVNKRLRPWQLPVRRLLEQQQRDNAKWISYKPQVLEKYIFNRYCDVCYDDETKSMYIRFLNTDSSKPPFSRVPFRIASSNDSANASANDSKDVLTVQVKLADRINIPPRQMQHWNQYQISA